MNKLLSLLLITFGCAQAEPDAGGAIPSTAPDYYVAVMPSQMSESIAGAVVSGVRDLGLSAKAGSIIELLDGLDLRSLGRVTVPDGNRNRRLRLLAKPLASVQGIVQKAVKESDTLQDVIRLPQALTFIGRRGQATRVVVWAAPGYRHPGDPEFVFEAPLYPNDAFLKAAPGQSIYGARGAETELDGISVYMCTPDSEWGDSLYRGEVSRFLGMHVNLKGGSWCGLESDSAEVVRRAVAGEKPMQAERWTLRPDETEFAMRTVEKPATVRPELPVALQGARMVLVQDTSGSAKECLDISRRAAWSIADRASRERVPLHMGVVLSGSAADTVILDLNPVHRDGRGRQGEGLEAARKFLEGEVLPDGSRAKPKMQSTGAVIDFVYGLERALDQLEAGPESSTPLLVLVGDQGSLAGGAKPEVQAQALARLKAFTVANPSTHILAVYTPGFDDETGTYGKASAAFFRDVAAAAGTSGTTANDPSWIEPWVNKVIAEQVKAR